MQTFQVKGMTCGHCERAVIRAVQALDSAAEVKVDLAKGEVRVASDVPAERLMEAIREEGYEVAQA